EPATPCTGRGGGTTTGGACGTGGADADADASTTGWSIGRAIVDVATALTAAGGSAGATIWRGTTLSSAASAGSRSPVVATASTSKEIADGVGAASSGAGAIIDRDSSADDSWSQVAPRTDAANTPAATSHGPRCEPALERRSWSNRTVMSVSYGR